MTHFRFRPARQRVLPRVVRRTRSVRLRHHRGLPALELWAFDTNQGSEAPTESGGDPACWQIRVCPHCGALAGTDPPTICEQCHLEIPDPTA
ncbi:MAG TPA: hypothetical protein VMV12_05570 [Candidatus Micrarchaeaceae archaeon]|nr:hypothetical protein [Candidatus Micrarchaeaceae archaeon]